MKINNYFSLQSLLKLHRQMTNKPNDMFRTVGEVMKWRDHLIEVEDREQHSTFTLNKRREAFIEYLEGVGDASYAESKAFIESRITDLKCATWFRSQQRMADIRAIQTFLERCGLSV